MVPGHSGGDIIDDDRFVKLFEVPKAFQKFRSSRHLETFFSGIAM
jgi:hypothetical protein